MADDKKARALRSEVTRGQFEASHSPHSSPSKSRLEIRVCVFLILDPNRNESAPLVFLLFLGLAPQQIHDLGRHEHPRVLRSPAQADFRIRRRFTKPFPRHIEVLDVYSSPHFKHSAGAGQRDENAGAWFITPLRAFHRAQ